MHANGILQSPGCALSSSRVSLPALLRQAELALGLDSTHFPPRFLREWMRSNGEANNLNLDRYWEDGRVHFQQLQRQLEQPERDSEGLGSRQVKLHRDIVEVCARLFPFILAQRGASDGNGSKIVSEAVCRAAGASADSVPLLVEAPVPPVASLLVVATASGPGRPKPKPHRRSPTDLDLNSSVLDDPSASPSLTGVALGSSL